MEKIDTDYKRRNLKSLAKLFKPFNRDWAPLSIAVNPCKIRFDHFKKRLKSRVRKISYYHLLLLKLYHFQLIINIYENKLKSNININILYASCRWENSRCFGCCTSNLFWKLKDSLEDLQYLRKLIREYTKKIYMIKTLTWLLILNSPMQF